MDEVPTFFNKPKINIGVLGHVDSGKTSICGALSTILSTAALDKNPQSQERGITLDLQFSAMETPNYLFTFTDCPGHASLIRTIIGGAQIIDMVLLVIDVNKGMQTQTAEGLVIAGITVDTLVVVLNKIDSIPEAEREKKLQRLEAGMKKALEKTPFKNALMVPFSAKEPANYQPKLVEVLGTEAENILVKRKAQLEKKEKLLILVDHCFPIKGKGTVATGTVLRGEVSVNQDLYIPHLKTTKKVKSMQMFKKPVQLARAGDRVGVLLTQFDASSMERGILCADAEDVPCISQAIVKINRIPYYKNPINSKAKFHVTMGHATVMATFEFFGEPEETETPFVADKEYKFLPTWEGNNCYGILHFETPTFWPTGSLFIASKLDSDINAHACRLAFNGTLINSIQDDAQLAKLKVFTHKEKQGIVERATSNDTVIAKNLFKKETDMSLFTNMNVYLPNGKKGRIEGSFGKSGKFKVYFQGGFGYSQDEVVNKTLAFPIKRYIYDKKKALRQ